MNILRKLSNPLLKGQKLKQSSRNLKYNCKFFLFYIGIPVGISFYTSWRISQLRIKMAEKTPPTLLTNDIIFLSKHDYFSRVLGNEKDYFIILIYQDDPNISETALKAAKLLKDTLDSKRYQGFNVYLINRTIITDIRKIIGRTKNINLFSSDDNPDPIEIYIKTPNNKDFTFINFNIKTFFNEKKQKKIGKRIHKIKNMIEIYDDKKDYEDFMQTLDQIRFGFNIPTVIIATGNNHDSSNKKESDRIINKFSKIAFICLERKLLPFETRFLIIQNKKIIDEIGLEKDVPYIMHNDIITAYERITDKEIEDKSDSIKVEIEGTMPQTIYLKKYFDNSLFSILEKNISEQEKRLIKEERLKKFINFMFPRIIVLKDMKYRSIGQLIKKSAINKEKYILSLYCHPHDQYVEDNINILMDLYKEYKDKFVFTIFENDSVCDMFPHAKSGYPSFMLFNYFKQKKDYGEYQNYYKSLVYPYEKYFISNVGNNNGLQKPNEKEIKESIKDVLNSKRMMDYLNVPSGNIQDLDSPLIEKFIQENINEGKNILIELYNDKVNSKSLNKLMDEFSEELSNNQEIALGRLNHLNQSPILLNFNEYPVFLYIDIKKKTIKYFIAEGRNEIEIKAIIKNKTVEKENYSLDSESNREKP